LLLKLIGNTFLVHEQTQALWVGECRGRGEDVQFGGHFSRSLECVEDGGYFSLAPGFACVSSSAQAVNVLY
jgi:hypothetical protein